MKPTIPACPQCVYIHTDTQMHNDLSDTSPRTPGIYIYILNHWVKKELTVGVSRLLYKVPDSNYFRFCRVIQFL